ncbi:MAG: hypothetical protein ACTS73_02295 [Arsenophonus sp. NEOnobi-MAG3]
MVDDIYSPVRQDDSIYMLVIIGVTEHGRKKVVTGEDAYRKSKAKFTELLNGLCEQRGLTVSFRLATDTMPLVFGMEWQRYSWMQSINDVGYKNI